MTNSQDMVAQIEALGEKLGQAKASINRRFIGQERVVDLTLTALLCGGHGLLVGLPGLGKTRLVETLSTVMGLDGNRVQFTPDLMPADILGSEVLDTNADGSRAFRFVKGPIFCQLLMADEINRASPRTQSALLQAMQEKAVTVAGEDRPLGTPFHVLATQNPIEQEGTYPLPEAQLDRFLVQIDVPYPDRATERDILLATTGDTEAEATAIFGAGELLEAQNLLRRMPVGDSVVEMILDLVRAFRPDDPTASQNVRETVAWGPGPRAAQALMLAVRARTLLDGRLAPSVEDVLDMARPVLSHRMALNFTARARGDTLIDLIDTTCHRPHHWKTCRVITPATLRARSEDQAARLPPLLARAEQLAGAVLLGDHGRRRAGSGDDFWQYRPAQIGDSRRMIDHRRSALGDQQFVREREWQIAQTVMLWCDQGASMRFNSVDTLPTKMDRARLLTMSLAILLNRGGERVGVTGTRLPPRRGNAQILRLAEMLSEEESAEYAPPEHSAMIPNAAAMFASDFLGDMAPVELALTKAADRGVRGVLLQVLDPSEEEFAFHGRTIFESVGGSMRHETLKANDLRNRYLARLAQRKDELQRLCTRTGWQYGLHNTEKSPQSGLLWLYQAISGGARL